MGTVTLAVGTTLKSGEGDKRLPGSGVSPTGGRGAGPPLLKTAGVDPPEIWTYQYIFFLNRMNFLHFPTFFEPKWTKSEEKLNFGGRWVWVPMTPVKNSWRRPCPGSKKTPTQN